MSTDVNLDAPVLIVGGGPVGVPSLDQGNRAILDQLLGNSHA